MKVPYEADHQSAEIDDLDCQFYRNDICGKARTSEKLDVPGSRWMTVNECTDIITMNEKAITRLRSERMIHASIAAILPLAAEPTRYNVSLHKDSTNFGDSLM